MGRSAHITIFKWGYDGWGNATKTLVRSVDAIERARGYESPIFVDIRYSRSVRAIGFRDHAFEKLLGHTCSAGCVHSAMLQSTRDAA